MRVNPKPFNPDDDHQPQGVARWLPDADAAISAKASKDGLGPPTSNLEFERARFWRIYGGTRVYWSPTTGAHKVYGAILDRYLKDGGHRTHGVPTTDEVSAGTGRGRMSEFEGYTLVWEPEKGVHEVHGAIRDEWVRLGGHRWATPISDELVAPNGGRVSHFWHAGLEGYSIYWHRDTGAHAIEGLVHAAWVKVGAERSFLGAPTQRALVAPARFQFGTIVPGPHETPYALPDSERREVHISTGGVSARGTWTMNSDGSWFWEGTCTNNVIIGHNVGIVAAVAFAGEDHKARFSEVEMHLGPNFAGNEETWHKGGKDSFIRDNWTAIRGAPIKTTMQTDVTLADVLTTAFWPVFLGIAAVIAVPFLSGDKELCPGHSYEYEDYDGSVHRGVSYPIRDRNEPCPPSNNP